MTKNKETELSRYCKDNCGLDAKAAADYAEIPRRTFYDWWGTKRRAMELVIKGIGSELNGKE
jgi:hypothetical protein